MQENNKKAVYISWQGEEKLNNNGNVIGENNEGIMLIGIAVKWKKLRN